MRDYVLDSIFRTLGNITFILVKRLDELVIKPLEGSVTLYYLTNNVTGKINILTPLEKINCVYE